MAHTRKHRSRKHRSRKNYRGGADASTYMMQTVGSMDQQYNNVFDINSPLKAQGNAIVGLQGQNTEWPANSGIDSAAIRSMTGGKRRRRRGGFLGPAINQAIVPLSILGMQQSYKKSKRMGGKRHSRRRGRRGGFLGQVINQAVVPFGILGMQQSYGRKKSRKN
jgi:hypothetical protein